MFLNDHCNGAILVHSFIQSASSPHSSPSNPPIFFISKRNCTINCHIELSKKISISQGHKMDDLREQLLQVKKAHTVALRDNAQCRTRLRIAERECKRREAEIQRLLSISNWNSSTAPGGGPSHEVRLELAALKRKLLLYERMLHEKSQENAKLMADKNVVQATESRKQLDKMEGECQRLRTHLAQSVPEAEFLREKDQYLAIINRLVEENMHLRQVIGEFEQRRRESEKMLAQLGGGDALVRQFRHSSISSRRHANYYKNALGNLVKRHGTLMKGSGGRTDSIGSISSRMTFSGGLAKSSVIKAILEESKKARRRRASLDSGQNLDELRTLDEEELADNGKDGKEGGRGKRVDGRKEEEEEKKGRNDESERSKEREEAIGNGFGLDRNIGYRPRSASSPGQRPILQLKANLEKDVEEQVEEEEMAMANGQSPPQSSRRSTIEEMKGEKEGRGKDEEEEMEDEEDEDDDGLVEDDGAEGPEDLETHLTALYRVLHSHVLRQQMTKIRQEREPPTLGMHLF